MVDKLSSSRDDDNFRRHGLPAYHANREVIDTRTRRLQCEIYAGRSPRSREGIRQSPLSDDGVLRRRDNALGSKLLHQAVADVELNLAVLNRRLSELDSKNRRRIRSLNAFVFDIHSAIRRMPLRL